MNLLCLTILACLVALASSDCFETTTDFVNPSPPPSPSPSPSPDPSPNGGGGAFNKSACNSIFASKTTVAPQNNNRQAEKDTKDKDDVLPPPQVYEP